MFSGDEIYDDNITSGIFPPEPQETVVSHTVTGRCKHCNLLYVWKPAPSKLIRHSWCRDCKRRLRATWAAGITSVPTVAGEPIFSRYQPE